MFKDREDAGKRLAKALEGYKNKDVLVLGIPRGGVIVAYYVAKRLNAQFSVVVARKLPYPNNPEAGFGAVAEDGSKFMFDYASSELPQEIIDRITREQTQEAKRRVEIFRGGKKLPEIRGKTVILVDDGIAMGSTMRAAILLCRRRKAKRVVVAAPVSGPDVARELTNEADEVVVLETPRFFQAVAQSYENWYDVPDEEVVEIMGRWEREQRK